ncbi:MAG: signal transduction histidine kinase [Parvicella sp.]|jgi:signal transduction histidine kinase
MYEIIKDIMKEAEVFINESERLESLKSYSILDTLTETDYDEITAIAAEICGTTISLISLIDDNRQWFKSHHGLEATETAKEYAFCAHAINDQNNVFIIPDARLDERFYDNPLVKEDPNIVFYAGVPLVSDLGLPLGTLCVIDRETKELSINQLQTLKALGHQVMNLLNLRKTASTLEKAMSNLEVKNRQLSNFARIASHNLRVPVSNLTSLIEFYNESQDNEDKALLFTKFEKVTGNLSETLEDLIESVKIQENVNITYESVNFKSVFNKNIEILERKILESKAIVTSDFSEIAQIEYPKVYLESIIFNLLSNAIKYRSDIRIPKIHFSTEISNNEIKLIAKDNGLGIDLKRHGHKIFGLNNTFHRHPDSKGIGLFMTKTQIEASGGTIQVTSEVDKGSTFKVVFKQNK